MPVGIAWAAVFGIVLTGICEARAGSNQDDKGVDAKLVEVHKYDKGCTVYQVDFLPNGRRALLGGDTVHAPMVLWDIDSGKSIREFQPPGEDHGIVVAASPDGLIAASSGISGAVTVWEIETARVLAECLHPGVVSGIAFAPDGRTFATSGGDGVVRLWDAQSGTKLAEFKDNGSPLTTVMFAPDGDRLLTSATDKLVRVWQVGGGIVQRMQHSEVVWSIAMSPVGDVVLSGTGGPLVGIPSFQDYAKSDDNTVRVWDLASGQLQRELLGHTHAVRRVALSPDRRLAASGGLDCTLRLWDIARGVELDCVVGESWVMGVDFSPDGKYLIASGGVHKEGTNWIRSPAERVRLFRIHSASQGEE